jgi:DNA gyrase subunit A
MLITSTGTMIRTPVSDVSTMSRNTQGVRLIRLDDSDRLVGISRVEALPGDDTGSPE